MYCTPFYKANVSSKYKKNHLILSTASWGQCDYHLHFIDEAAEAQQGSMLQSQ